MGSSAESIDMGRCASLQLAGSVIFPRSDQDGTAALHSVDEGLPYRGDSACRERMQLLVTNAVLLLTDSIINVYIKWGVDREAIARVIRRKEAECLESTTEVQ